MPTRVLLLGVLVDQAADLLLDIGQTDRIIQFCQRVIGR